MEDRRQSQMMNRMLDRPMWIILCLSETIDNYCILIKGRDELARKTTWIDATCISSHYFNVPWALTLSLEQIMLI